MTEADPKETCNNCKFFKTMTRTNKSEYCLGTCARFPPTLDHTLIDSAGADEAKKNVYRTLPFGWHWPRVGSDSWCGEWQQSTESPLPPHSPAP